MRFVEFCACLFFFLLLGCSDSGFSKNEDPAESSDSSSASDSSETENPLYKDMELVRAGVVTLGTDDSSAPSSERPSMEVTLDYDFWMDKHEVTCGEFYKVMKEAGYKSIAKCDDDDLPRVNVTYYDAILYANARSALENLDSSYSYTKVNMNSEGNCTNLEGLEFIPGANGFRLPTESEWMLVASIGWDKEKSWNSKNSKNKLHPVCSATDDDAKFCDFEGNALEWVNDWMVAYKDTSLTNFAGGNFPNELAERVLKGGAYLRSPEEIRITGRTDVYTVTSQTMAEYVGFRLAQGKIENPVYLDQSGRAATSPVVILASSSTLNNVIKTRKAKLVFRNDVTGNLSYIDYNSSPLQVVEIQDSLTVYHPDVSPDGNWVAFCTLIEGVSGNSSVYVRSLDSAGNGLVKLDVEAAAIPRWRVLDGDTGIVYVTDAGNNSDDALWKKQGTWFVGFSNGKFGKSRKLLDGAYHGGYDEKSGMAVSGSKLLRAYGDDDEIWYNGEQACNVSLSQDGTLRTAFLDFSGKTGIEFVGTKYRVHERLLVANQNDSLIFSLASPKGYTMDHTEWAETDQESFIVGAFVDNDGVHQKIFLADLEKGEFTELAKGEELWHPDLWIERIGVSQDSATEMSSLLDADSAGVYYKDGAAFNLEASIMRFVMEVFWENKDSVNTVILGSSRSAKGVIPAELSSDYFAINMSCDAASLYDSKYVFDNYVMGHLKNLKYLILAVDIDRWYRTPSSSVFYKYYRDYPGFAYDEDHGFWKDSSAEYTDELYLRTSRAYSYSAYGSMVETRGYRKMNVGGWGALEPSAEYDSTWRQDEPSRYTNSLEAFESIVSKAEQHDIKVLGVIFPQSPHYKNTGAFGKSGLTRSEIPEIMQDLENLSDRHRNFTLMDENKMGEHDYTDEMAQDKQHLAHPGALVITGRINRVLDSLRLSGVEE